MPAKYSWASLLKRDGDELEAHYRHILEELGKQPGHARARSSTRRGPEIQNPATLRRLIVDLIDAEKWSSMEADVKGDIYEGCSQRTPQDTKGAGQYFTPRELIKAIVDCMRPTPDDTVCDPACGTGGFLLAAHDYVVKHHGKTSTRTRRSTCKDEAS